MLSQTLYNIEDIVLKQMVGKFVNVTDPARKREMIIAAAKSVSLNLAMEDIKLIVEDINDLAPISDYLTAPNIEDIMVNNTQNVFVFDAKDGAKKIDSKAFNDKEKLNRFVNKLKLYSTNQEANGNIQDVHMPNGSRANIITSPLGYDITIRNFKSTPISIIDLINYKTLDYHMAARLWLYVDGFRIRPANIMIGGVPAAGKTTLLNAMFSFFRPEQRIVTIEETYELDTSTQENTAKLETSQDLTLMDLVKNSLRMRPDMLIIGEVRGPEANDLLSAMNIGKICMGTIHASSTRDMINRLEHSPMNVPQDIIPAIDALIVVSVVYENGIPYRKVIQVSEISGIETQILLSDLYKFDYKTHQGSQMLPSVTYRDKLAKVLGIAPPDILAEEVVRARILEQLNKIGKRDMASISQMVKAYYEEPEKMLAEIGLPQLSPVIRV